MTKTYWVDTTAFYERFNPPSEWNPRIQEAVRQLVERYGLREMHILGIGSGASQEEFWLWKLGANRLTIVDIDEHGQIEPILKTLPRGDLAFHVGDALEYFASPSAVHFDVIYVSGLTPDEERRFEILWGKKPPSPLRRMLYRLGAHSWPRDADPFHPILMDAAKLLNKGGFLIVQSIGFGIDALRNPYFLPAIERQLSAHKIELLEVYRWQNSGGVNLYVGRAKGGSPLTFGAPIRFFHGRGEPHQPATRIWPRQAP